MKATTFSKTKEVVRSVAKFYMFANLLVPGLREDSGILIFASEFDLL